MNIFYLDRNIQKCAQQHVNKHCSKMILEYVQLLCSALHLSGKDAPYKLTHKNHPCAIWVRQSLRHWLYLWDLTQELHKEFQLRYEKPHKSGIISESLDLPDIEDNGWVDPPQAMPDAYKHQDVVTAYRQYYIGEKQHIAKWGCREIPEWYELKG